MSRERSNIRRKKAERVTLLGSALDLILGIVKIAIGVIGHSTALIADGLHSLSDVATDFMVIVVMRHAAKAPDQQHPFGHQRFETAGSVAMGLALVAVAVAMAWQSVEQLFSGNADIRPTWPVLVVAALSVISKEWIYRYTLRVGHELQSDLLVANAWHSRSDAFSSVVVFIAVLGAMLGAPWLDTLAAIVIALMIAKIAWDLILKNLSELVDSGLPEDEIHRIHSTALTVPGVEGIHSLRGRTMAGQVLLELHVEVANALSASEAHFIGNQVRDLLLNQFPKIREVIFHIDTHSNQADDKSLQLPNRREIEATLNTQLTESIGNYVGEKDYELTLYYTSDKVNIEIKLLADVEQVHLLQQQIAESLADRHWFGGLTLWRKA